MKAPFPLSDPVPQLMDELIDALYLLEQCRRRDVHDVSRLLDYIDYTIHQIEQQRLGSTSQADTLSPEVSDVAC